MDPFRGYKNAVDEHLADAVAVVDAFLPRMLESPRVVKLTTSCMDDVRRRVQHHTPGHHGKKSDQPTTRVGSSAHSAATCSS